MVDVSAGRRAQLAAVQGLFTAAVEEMVSGDDWLAAIAFSARFRDRSFQNSMLIWVQHETAFAEGRVTEPYPSLVAGYQQWSSVGRQVNKGQRGYKILAPVTSRWAWEGDDRNQGHWVAKGDRPGPGERVENRMRGTRVVTVFDISQTTGDPVSQLRVPELMVGEVPADLRDNLVTELEAKGFTVAFLGGEIAGYPAANSVTRFDSTVVEIRGGMSEAQTVKTLAHELGHIALGHGVEAVATRRGVKEIEAESFAHMITASFGMDSTGYSVPYVASWATAADAKPATVVREVADRVKLAVTPVLDRIRPQPRLIPTKPLFEASVTRFRQPHRPSLDLGKFTPTRHPLGARNWADVVTRGH